MLTFNMTIVGGSEKYPGYPGYPAHASVRRSEKYPGLPGLSLVSGVSGDVSILRKVERSNSNIMWAVEVTPDTTDTTTKNETWHKLSKTCPICGKTFYKIGQSVKSWRNRSTCSRSCGKRKPWMPSEIEFMRRNYESIGPSQCGIALKRSMYAAYHMAAQLGLYYQATGGTKVEDDPTPEEIEQRKAEVRATWTEQTYRERSCR